VRDQQQSDAGLVRFERAQLGILLAQRSELHDGRDDEEKIVFVIIVQQHLPWRQRLRGFVLGLGLFRALWFGLDRDAAL
jgi:hypothetical protein